MFSFFTWRKFVKTVQFCLCSYSLCLLKKLERINLRCFYFCCCSVSPEWSDFFGWTHQYHHDNHLCILVTLKETGARRSPSLLDFFLFFYPPKQSFRLLPLCSDLRLSWTSGSFFSHSGVYITMVLDDRMSEEDRWLRGAEFLVTEAHGLGRRARGASAAIRLLRRCWALLPTMQFCRKVLCQPCSARVTSPEEDMEYKMGSCIGISRKQVKLRKDAVLGGGLFALLLQGRSGSNWIRVFSSWRGKGMFCDDGGEI